VSDAAISVRRGIDLDRVFVGVCLAVPLTALLVFFAYPLATVKGRDPDRPRGLKKVTVTH